MTQISHLTDSHIKAAEIGNGEFFSTLWVRVLGEQVELVQLLTEWNDHTGRFIVDNLGLAEVVDLEEAHDVAEDMEALAIRSLENLGVRPREVGFGRKVDALLMVAA